ncbi:DUF167-domain-containing protein [Ramaria rubella]|nr:DUF167-domain-containing protein [Ramaria rubella]
MRDLRAVTCTRNGIRIRLHVKPNSNVDRIVDFQQDKVHIAVTNIAKEGEANRGVRELLAKVLGVRKSDTTIVAGQKSREKIILIERSTLTTDSGQAAKYIANVVKRLRQAMAR